MNAVIISGNLTKNPEVIVSKKGDKETAIAKFGIGNNDNENSPFFMNVVAFGRNAEICGEFLSKGSKVLIDGHLTYKTWEQDGQKRHAHEIVVDRLEFMDSKKSSDNVDAEEPKE
jgi:single-strand DNA-binding protein